MYCYSISELTKKIMESVIPESSIGLYNYSNVEEPIDETFSPIDICNINNEVFNMSKFFGNISHDFHWSDFFHNCSINNGTLIVAVPSIMKDLNDEEYFLGECFDISTDKCNLDETIPVNHFFRHQGNIPIEFILGYCNYSDEEGFKIILNSDYIGFKSNKEQAEFFESIKKCCTGIKPLNGKTKLDIELEEKFSQVTKVSSLYETMLKKKLDSKKIESYRSKKVQKELEYIMKEADDKVVNNPAFLTHFEYACRKISESTGEENFKVEIHDDGKKIYVYELSEEKNEIKNRYFESFMFSLEGDSLVVDRATSRAYDITSSELEKNNFFDFEDKKTAVDLNYSQTIYDNNGIELSRSNLSNVEFLQLDIPCDELDLVALTLSNKYMPEMTIDNLPIIPEGLSKNYEANFSYRTHDNLAIAYCKTSFCTKDACQSSNDVFVVNSDYPERLVIRFNEPLATWNDELEDYEVSDPILLGQLSFDEIYALYKERFMDFLEESKTKLENPIMYNTMQNLTNNINHKTKKKVNE